MNKYLVECLECEDEVEVTCHVDIPAFCPFCGGGDVEISKRQEPLLWEDHE